MTTAYVTHADCLRHEMGEGHPESPNRLAAINEHMRGSGLLEQLSCLDAPLAQAADLERVHDPAYIERIFAEAPRAGYVYLDPDTAMNPFSLDAARRAAGAGLAAVDEVIAGRAVNAFCAVRPCGHHATRNRSMGFCIFNNVAVAAAYALSAKHIARVAIIDFDVHHGNGTEDVFANAQWAERVLMAGFFQHPFYPHSGSPGSWPNMVNVPLTAGSGGVAARRAVEEHWLPALQRFQPEMIFISAGFDAHCDDLLGGLSLTDADYVWLTSTLMEAAGGYSSHRIVSMLEGGYNLQALGRCVVAHVATLSAQ